MTAQTNKQSEKLIELEAQLTAIDKVMAVIHFDMDGHILSANKNFLTAVGYGEDEIIGQHHSMFVEESYRDSEEYRAFWRALNQGEFSEGEFKRVGKNGKELWLQASYNPILDEQGLPFKVVKFATDITAAKAQQLKAAQLAGAMGNSGTPCMLIDRDLCITYINKSTLALFRKHEEVFQKNWPGFKADEDYVIGTCIDTFHKQPEHQRKLLGDANNLPYQTDIQIDELTFQLNVTAIYDSDGCYMGNALEWQDVTEVRKNQLEVGRLSSAVEGMTTNLMMADRDGNIVYMNPAVEKMLRLREQKLRELIPSFNVDTLVGTNFDGFHKNPAHQRQLLSDPTNMPYTVEIGLAELEFQLTAIALIDVDGQHVGTAVQWVDITEQKDAQRQVDRLIQAAIQGELDARIDTENYQGFMKELGHNINNLMEAVVEPLAEAIETAKALAEGRLDKMMDGNYKGEFKALADAMNSSMNKLNAMVGEIRSASMSVFNAAREIADGNNDLSKRTESQAASLEETASAMEQLTSTVRQNADNTTQASNLSSEVMAKATNGGEVVKSAIAAMTEINKSSKEIADIISVIDEIAFQTNLLALNAAVEAARAGDQGRGFAVVAAEVRNLAQRSAGAAKEIKSLINDSVEAVGQGSKLVDETGQTFSHLVSAIEEVSSMISDIDGAGKEQAAGIGEVSSAVAQMDEMTQQNAALVEEASASSKSMEEQAQALLEQMSFFKASEGQQELEAAKSNSAKVEKLASISSLEQRNEESIGSPLRAAGGSDQDWEEF
jgi:methyl-accepting chemotaxis protein